jgi:hypothetical protein
LDRVEMTLVMESTLKHWWKARTGAPRCLPQISPLPELVIAPVQPRKIWGCKLPPLNTTVASHDSNIPHR